MPATLMCPVILIRATTLTPMTRATVHHDDVKLQDQVTTHKATTGPYADNDETPTRTVKELINSFNLGQGLKEVMEMEEKRESNRNNDERNMLIVNCDSAQQRLKAASLAVETLNSTLNIALNANANAATENRTLIEQIASGERRELELQA